MNKDIQTLKQEVTDVLTQNILPFWLDKMQDKEYGGFYGQMTGRYELNKEADKGAILNARILWSFSAIIAGLIILLTRIYPIKK